MNQSSWGSKLPWCNWWHYWLGHAFFPSNWWRSVKIPAVEQAYSWKNLWLTSSFNYFQLTSTWHRVSLPDLNTSKFLLYDLSLHKSHGQVICLIFLYWLTFLSLSLQGKYLHDLNNICKLYFLKTLPVFLLSHYFGLIIRNFLSLLHHHL